jgi:putative ABC transport system substrate-binding protein
MSKKVFCLALGAMLLTLSFLADAEQPVRVYRIGYLTATSPSVNEGFRQALRNLNYIEGNNIVIEPRFAEGKVDRLPELAAELVRLNVDVMVVASSQAVRAAKQTTTTIPIVMAVSGDVVGTGLVASLAHPGGNVTGMSIYSPEINGKRLELLKEAFPKVSRIAVLGDPTGPGHTLNWQELEAARRSLQVQLQSLEVRSPNPDFEGAFATAAKGHADAFLALDYPLLVVHRKQIVALVAKSRLPAIFHQRDFVDAGGLMSYGPNHTDSYRRAAVYVDKILKGTKPATCLSSGPRSLT